MYNEDGMMVRDGQFIKVTEEEKNLMLKRALEDLELHGGTPLHEFKRMMELDPCIV